MLRNDNPLRHVQEPEARLTILDAEAKDAPRTTIAECVCSLGDCLGTIDRGGGKDVLTDFPKTRHQVDFCETLGHRCVVVTEHQARGFTLDALDEGESKFVSLGVWFCVVPFLDCIEIGCFHITNEINRALDGMGERMD